MTTNNLYRALMELIPDAPLQVATVVSRNTTIGTSIVAWPGGEQQTVRGATVAAGGTAFVRNGVIEGVAPSLTFETIEV